MSDTKRNKRFAKQLGFSDSREVGRQLIEYRNRKANRQAKRCQAASLKALKELFPRE